MFRLYTVDSPRRGLACIDHDRLRESIVRTLSVALNEELRKTETTFENFARDKFIIGDKVSVKEEITRYNELLGVDHFIIEHEVSLEPIGQELLDAAWPSQGGQRCFKWCLDI